MQFLERDLQCVDHQLKDKLDYGRFLRRCCRLKAFLEKFDYCFCKYFKAHF